MSDGLAMVQARISEITALFGPPPSAPAADGGAGGSTAIASGTSGSGTQFAGALAQILGETSTGAGSPSGTGSAALGGRAVELAGSFTGVRYRWGGTDPATGLDCSGLTQLVYGRLGVTLPRVAADQAKAGTEVPSLAQARPGDLVFFGSPAHHVGIYAGNNTMIDAPHSGSTVGVHTLWGTPSAIRRVTGNDGLAVSGQATTTVRAGALTGPYATLFAAAGNRYGVDPALLSAVAKVESGYDPSAVSGAGAQGLMQLMPATARSLGVDARDPTQAVDGAARLLGGLLDRYGGNVELALAGYNAGPGAVSRYGGVPPYPETQTYVRRVTSYWEALR